MTIITRALLGVAPAALLAASAATAQSVPSTAEPTDTAQAAPGTTQAAPDTGGVGEVVVTAQRRAENLQNVPVSVGVLSGDEQRTFAQGGDDTLLSLSGRVPGLYVETTTGRIFPRFYIRGLGNIDFYLGASQPVEIIQDDIVLEHVVLKSNPVYDVAQTEVLRGPQGSLFGRNTTAGIIKFDTIKPTQDFEGRATISDGTYNTFSLDAGVGGPLVPGLLAVRVSTLLQHRENFVDNRYTGPSADGTAVGLPKVLGGYDDRNVRVQFLLTPVSRLSIEASGHARWYDGTSTLFHRGALHKGSNSTAGDPRNAVTYDEAQDNPQAYTTYGGSVRAALDLDFATLTSITGYETSSGYSRGDTDGGAAALFPVNGVPNGFGQSQGRLRSLDQWTQEVRLASPGGRRFTWQLGGIYFDQRDFTEFDQRAFFLTTAAYNPNNSVLLHDINTSWGAFGQFSYKITPTLTFTGGARVTEDDKRTVLLKTANTQANTVTYTGRRDVSLSDTQPSWDASLLWAVDPRVSLYARVARGFRGPTIQGRSAVFNTDFTTAGSETNLSEEVGFKSNLLSDTLRFNASVFHYRVNNIQLNGNDVNGNGVLFNADHAEAYGLEAEATWRPVRDFTLGLGASALHSAIRDRNVYAQVCALNGVVVCTVQDPLIKVGTGYFAQINGEPLPNAPRYNVDATARYDLPLGNDGRLFAGGDFNIQGHTQFVLYRTKEFYANGNYELGLQLGYAAPGDKWEIAAFARNVTNQKNLKGVIENYLAAVYNEPRVIGVTLSGRFR